MGKYNVSRRGAAMTCVTNGLAAGPALRGGFDAHLDEQAVHGVGRQEAAGPSAQQSTSSASAGSRHGSLKARSTTKAARGGSLHSPCCLRELARGPASCRRPNCVLEHDLRQELHLARCSHVSNATDRRAEGRSRKCCVSVCAVQAVVDAGVQEVVHLGTEVQA